MTIPAEGPILVRVDAEIADLIPSFLRYQREGLLKMRQAAAGGDLATLRSHGHSLKGCGGGYGFHGLSELGRELETAAKQGDLDEAVQIVEAVGSYLDRVDIRIE